MPDILNLDVSSKPLTADAQQKAQTVKRIGNIALTFSVSGIFTPFVASVAAFVLAKIAMKIARENLTPVKYENPAYWAYRVSIFGMILWVGIVIRFFT